ncbi:hypothetical protein [Roseovarius confluentis]|uniref:hypothetical protein n=1 Tax=Roseovarius confluentis TaxID=1852027 RepID=UPI003BAA9F2A
MIRGDERGAAYKDVDFRNTEELAALLWQIAMTVHAKNRIAGGESSFLWYLAEAIQSVSQLAQSATDDPQLQRLYGDAHYAGSLADEAKREHFLGLLSEAFAGTK